FQVLRKVFPPIVTGVTVFLIGAALVGTGFKFWGGGAFCGDNVNSADPPLKRGGKALGQSINQSANRLTSQAINQSIYLSINQLLGNGEVLLPFGSAEYVGLGFSVFAMLVSYI
ncbi:unnamed protein product, partial [Laminaria digitata]